MGANISTVERTYIAKRSRTTCQCNGHIPPEQHREGLASAKWGHRCVLSDMVELTVSSIGVLLSNLWPSSSEMEK